jgi:hypothetical protein
MTAASTSRADWVYPTGTLAEPFRPVAVDDVTLAFPARVDHLLPHPDAIPEEFWQESSRDARKWIEFQRAWFYFGIKPKKVKMKDGIDKEAALRHLAAIQESYEPKHQYKEAAVAYLASLWFAELTFEKRTKP